MKAIQITIDEHLLRRLDADAEVQELGRSAVFRRAVERYLRLKRAAGIDESYARAYQGREGLDKAWEGWSDEGVWPED